jgi:hypothetical protein
MPRARTACPRSHDTPTRPPRRGSRRRPTHGPAPARAPCRPGRNTAAKRCLPARGRARGSRPRGPRRGFDARSPPARRAPRGGGRAALPEGARPLGVIRGELDQRQPRVGHPSKGTARSSTISAGSHPARPDPSSSPTAPGSPCSSSPCRAACDRTPAIPRRCSPGSPATAPRAPARCARGWSVTPGRSRCPTRPPHTERAPGQRPLGRRRAGARRSSAPRGTRRWPDALDTRRPTTDTTSVPVTEPPGAHRA